jgi:O-antigen/teichoic acid export membrane protein
MNYLLEFKNKFFNNKLALDSFWALVGSVAAKGLSLSASVVVARFLGKASFGEYGIIRNTLLYIAIFSTFGLGYTATKYVSEYKIKSPEKLIFFCRNAFRITLFVSGIMALFLFLFSNYVAVSILESPRLNIPLKYVSIWVVFNALTTTQTGILSGFGEFKKMAKINGVIGVITFFSSTVLTFFYGLEGALIALLVSQIVNWYLNYKVLIHYLPKTGASENNKDFVKEIILFSLPIALQEALYSATSWLSLYLLIKMTSYGELGLYSAAMQWAAVILFIPAILRNVVLSHMSEATDDLNKHNMVLKKMLKINFLSTIIPFIFVFLFSGLIVAFYGATFKGLQSVLNIAVFTSVFACLSSVYSQAYMSRGKNWLMLLLRLFRDLGILVLTYFLITSYTFESGAKLMVISSLLMNFVFFVIMAFYYELFLNKKEKI